MRSFYRFNEDVAKITKTLIDPIFSTVFFQFSLFLSSNIGSQSFQAIIQREQFFGDIILKLFKWSHIEKFQRIEKF